MTNNIENNSICETLFKPVEGSETEQKGDFCEENISYWRRTFQSFFRCKSAVFCTTLMLALILFALIQPILPGQKDPFLVYNDPQTGMQLMNQPPNEVFWLGTNKLGQDLWARLWYGTRISLLIGAAVALIRSSLGIILGLLWGYVRKMDALFTEIYNVMDNIPSTIILLVASYLLKPGIMTMILAMCATGWIGSARSIRNQVILIRDRDYNKASHCLGTPLWRILLHNILPHTLAMIILQIANAIPAAIGNEVFLTYLGLGLPASCPSLGNLVNIGRSLIMTETLRYQFYAPALILSLITVSFYVMGRCFSEAANPKNHI